jgi:hypothetical protein
MSRTSVYDPAHVCCRDGVLVAAARIDLSKNRGRGPHYEV